MNLKKDNVIKKVPDNLVSIYKNMGWVETTEDVEKKDTKSQQSQSTILNQSSGNK